MDSSVIVLDSPDEIQQPHFENLPQKSVFISVSEDEDEDEDELLHLDKPINNNIDDIIDIFGNFNKTDHKNNNHSFDCNKTNLERISSEIVEIDNNDNNNNDDKIPLFLNNQKNKNNNHIPSDVICLDDDEINNISFTNSINLSDVNIRNTTNKFNSYPSSPHIDKSIDFEINDLNDSNDFLKKSKSSIRVEVQTLKQISKQQSRSSSFIDSLNSIILDDIPLPFPQAQPKKKSKTLSSSQPKARKVDHSSSIGSITVPTTKPKSIINNKNIPLNSKTFMINQTEINKTRATNLKSSSPVPSRNIFDPHTKKNPNTNLPSDIALSISSLDDIRYQDEMLSDDEISKLRKQMKAKKKQEQNNIKAVISDLAQIRNGNLSSKSSTNQLEKTINSVLKGKNDVDIPAYDSSEIINSSTEFTPRNKFMENVTDDINLYSEEKLELLLERARDIEPQKLKRVNLTNFTKDELTEKITCCFSSCLDEKLKGLNPNYSTFITPAKFEVFEDQILPVIKFKRYLEAVYFQKRNAFIPIKPRNIEENFVILVYESEDLFNLLKNGIMKRHLTSIKKKNKDIRIAVWIIGYDKYLQSVKSKADRIYKQAAYKKLGQLDETNKKKRKKDESDETLIYPEDFSHKLLRYEVQFDFSFQSFKGLKDLIDWLLSIAYTLSSKHFDNLERNEKFSNLGKIKSGDNSKDCLIQMLSQIKGLTENRAKNFVESKSYNSINDLFNDIITGTDFTEDGSLRTDHQRALRKVFLSRNENDLL
jgi:hypothetical protein